MYLLGHYHIDKIKAGELTLEEFINNPQNIALVTWSGEDVAQYLEKKKTNPDNLEEIITRVRKNMDNCDCAMCFEIAVDAAVAGL